jgi:hypothetical protein
MSGRYAFGNRLMTIVMAEFFFVFLFWFGQGLDN